MNLLEFIVASMTRLLKVDYPSCSHPLKGQRSSLTQLWLVKKSNLLRCLFKNRAMLVNWSVNSLDMRLKIRPLSVRAEEWRARLLNILKNWTLRIVLSKDCRLISIASCQEQEKNSLKVLTSTKISSSKIKNLSKRVEHLRKKSVFKDKMLKNQEKNYREPLKARKEI